MSGPAAARFRYRLEAGLVLRPDAAGGAGILAADRPLMAMRLNAAGYRLLQAVQPEGATAAAAARAAGIDAARAKAFLDEMAARRLVSSTPAPPDPGSPAHWPRVSIIIAARGRHLSTRACVRSLLALDGGGGTRPEIIVVDDASDPPLQPFLAGLGVRLLRLDTNVGPGEGRNRGARLATGDVLAFIDNDCLADPGWLARLVPHFADPAVAIAGGRVTAPLPTGWLARYEAVRSPLDMGPRPGPVGPDAAIAYLPTCNFLVRRDAFIAVGGFTPAMRVGEDVDLCWRIIAAGGRATYDPSGRVVHRHRLRLAEMLARRADYGASEADLQQRHPAGRRLLPLPAAGLAGLAALTLATAGSIPGALGAAALALALVQLEIRVRRRRIGRLRPELPAGAVGRAVLRAHGAALYRLSGSIGRYYGLPLAVAVALVPALLPAALILWLLAPAVDHRRLAPGMPLAAYVGLHGLEMAAYQAGVWRGCLARRTLRPLLPALRLRR